MQSLLLLILGAASTLDDLSESPIETSVGETLEANSVAANIGAAVGKTLDANSVAANLGSTSSLTSTYGSNQLKEGDYGEFVDMMDRDFDGSNQLKEGDYGEFVDLVDREFGQLPRGEFQPDGDAFGSKKFTMKLPGLFGGSKSIKIPGIMEYTDGDAFVPREYYPEGANAAMGAYNKWQKGDREGLTVILPKKRALMQDT